MVRPFPLKIASNLSLVPPDRRPGLGRVRVREVGSEVEVGGELVALAAACAARDAEGVRVGGCVRIVIYRSVSVEVVADGVELLERADVDEVGVLRLSRTQCEREEKKGCGFFHNWSI